MPHCESIKALGYPTELRPFLKSCGNTVNPVHPEQFSKDMLKKVNQVIKEIAAKLDVWLLVFKLLQRHRVKLFINNFL